MRIRSIAIVLLLIAGACAAAECTPDPARGLVETLVGAKIDAAADQLAEWRARAPRDPAPGFYTHTIAWARVEAEWDRAERRRLARAITQEAEDYVESLAAARAATPDDPRLELLAGLGSALAGRAALEDHQWFRAHRFGRAGRDTLRQLVTAHPDQADAYYVLGLYEYYTGSVPFYLRWLTAALDLSGDATLGVRYLERAVRDAPTLAPEAARMLLEEVMWTPGVERCRYWPLAMQARQHFPDNPQFALAHAALASQCGHAAAGLVDLTQARRRFADEPRLTPYFDYWELLQREATGDVAWLDAHRPVQAQALGRWRLALARANDVAGTRAEALRHYAEMSTADNVPAELRAAAQTGTQHPFRPPPEAAGDATLRLRECGTPSAAATPIRSPGLL